MDEKLEQLQEKVSKEWNKLLEEASKLDKKGLSERIYELGWKNEIDCLVQDGNIWEEEMIDALLDEKNTLHTLYNYWLNFKTSGVDDDLQYFSHEYLKNNILEKGSRSKDLFEAIKNKNTLCGGEGRDCWEVNCKVRIFDEYLRIETEEENGSKLSELYKVLNQGEKAVMIEAPNGDICYLQ